MNHLPPDWALPQWRPVMPELAYDFSKKEFDTARSEIGLDRAVSVVDGQPIEVINLAGGPQLLRRVHELCNGALRCGVGPPLWKDVAITVLYKGKESRTDCNSWRGLSVMSHLGKLLERLILNRLQRVIDRTPGCIPDSQCGFVGGKSTVDALLISRILTCQAVEANLPLYKCYIDLTKAYDRVHRETLWEILRRLGVPPALIKLIASLHDGAVAMVKGGGGRQSGETV